MCEREREREREGAREDRETDKRYDGPLPIKGKFINSKGLYIILHYVLLSNYASCSLF